MTTEKDDADKTTDKEQEEKKQSDADKDKSETVTITDDDDDTAETPSSGKKDGDAKGESEGSSAAQKESSSEEKKKEEPKVVDWPLRGITEPHENDVLYGRGGGTNHHPGNKRYRKMVEDRKLDYVNSKRLDKPLVALEIIREWRGQNPPGRFLKIDEKTGLWTDVGDKKAREKTSQALREKAPQIRKQQEEERMSKIQDGGDGKDDAGEADNSENEKGVKTTRFAEGTNTESRTNKLKKSVLARDHSLGREYLQAGEAVTLDGFSWQDPFHSGSSSGAKRQGNGNMEPPPPYNQARMGSHGSMPPPQGGDSYRYSSHGSAGGYPEGMGPPPPPGHQRIYSGGRVESWGNGSAPPPMPGYSYPQQHASGGWGQRDVSQQRDHSLGRNPLAHASVSQPASYHAFDGRTASGQQHWGPAGPPGPPYGPPPMEGQYPSYSAAPREYGREYSGSRPIIRTNSSGPPSPPYAVDPAVAGAWSGQDPSEIAKTWSGSSEECDVFRSDLATPSLQPRPRNGHHGQHHNHHSGTSTGSGLRKPDVVKRATSNQNETLETKPDLVGPSVKRAALNRDNSTASNRLKEKYLPNYNKQNKRSGFDADVEVKKLSDNLEQSKLSNTGLKPEPLSKEERTSTLELIAMDLMTGTAKPSPLSLDNRTSTIDALNLDLDNDPLLSGTGVKPQAPERSATMEGIMADLKKELPKPGSISGGDRLTTNDFLAMVNEPIAEDETDDFAPGAGKEKPFDVFREASVTEWAV